MTAQIFEFPITPRNAADRPTEQLYRCTNCGHQETWCTRVNYTVYCDGLTKTEWPFKKGWVKCGAEMRPVEE